MARLGQLERVVMDTIWGFAAAAPVSAFTAREVASTLPDHAYTTVLTVMDRLTRKGLLDCDRAGKTHHYRPTGSRESYVTELMHEALASTSDAEAALVHFARSVTPAQANVLRDVLRAAARTKGD